jgi:hypothetical protein
LVYFQVSPVGECLFFDGQRKGTKRKPTQIRRPSGNLSFNPHNGRSVTRLRLKHPSLYSVMWIKTQATSDWDFNDQYQIIFRNQIDFVSNIVTEVARMTVVILF